MDLETLVSKPKLIAVTLPNVELDQLDVDGNPIIIKEVSPKLNADGQPKFDLEGNPILTQIGEHEKYYSDITFYTKDRQPLDVYLKLSLRMNKDQEASIELLKELILNKDGNRIIVDDRIPPVNVQVLVMAKVMELLGK